MTSVRGWHTGKLWFMAFSASLRTVDVFFFIIYPLYNLSKALGKKCFLVSGTMFVHLQLLIAINRNVFY